MSLEERVRREKHAHEDDDVLQRSLELKQRFPHILRYPSLANLLRPLGPEGHADAGRLRVLDFGCGRGDRARAWSEAGAATFAFDISEPYVRDAVGSASVRGAVMDAHRLAWADASFDMVVGDGILHHLDTATALPEIVRVLRPGGRAYFREPLLDNPLLRLFRALTPKARTPDEEPFSADALAELEERVAPATLRLSFCGLLSSPAALVTSLVPGLPADNRLLRGMARAEKALVDHLPRVGPWSQYVLLSVRKPGR